MKELRYTLVADGPSDQALIPILDWLLRETGKLSLSHGRYADFARIRKPSSLADRMRQAVKLYPCDLLFVHRDSEKQAPELRYREIQQAAQEAFNTAPTFPCLCVVPIRMQEAWLLMDESVVRKARGGYRCTSR